MRKVIAIALTLSLLIGSLVMGTTTAQALDYATVAVTATGSYLDVSITGGAWELNTGDPIAVNDWYYTNPLGETTSPSSPVVDGECTHTFSNDSSVAVDATIEWPDMTGTGNPWVNSDDGSNGSMVFGAKAQVSGLNWSAAVLAKQSVTFATLVSNLAATGDIKFVLGFNSPTAFTDANSKTCNVKLQASEHA